MYSSIKVYSIESNEVQKFLSPVLSLIIDKEPGLFRSLEYKL